MAFNKSHLTNKYEACHCQSEFPFLVDTSPLRAPWKRVNDIVITKILNTVSNDISNSMHFIDSAYAI